MLIKTVLIFLTFYSSHMALSIGDEGHSSSNEQQKPQLDDDGFEIITTAPSKETLAFINELYKKDVKPVFIEKCLNCHGTLSSFPWYYSIPGVKQMMNYDIREAHKHMDMRKDFPFGGHGAPVDDLKAIKKTMQKNTMPPWRYLLVNWDSGLTEVEKKKIIEWVDVSLKRLQK